MKFELPENINKILLNKNYHKSTIGKMILKYIYI